MLQLMKLLESSNQKVQIEWNNNNLRYKNKGLYNEDGYRYTPFIVRIGPNVHHSLKDISLEYLVAREKELRNLKGDDDQSIRIAVNKYFLSLK